MPNTYNTGFNLQNFLNDLRASNLWWTKDTTPQTITYVGETPTNAADLLLLANACISGTHPHSDQDPLGYKIISPYVGTTILSDILATLQAPTLYLGTTVRVLPDGSVNANSAPIKNLPEPTDPQDATTKSYVDAADLVVHEYVDSSVAAANAKLAELFSLPITFSDLVLASTIGDVDYYAPNQVVLIETADICPTADPDSNTFVGWSITGTGIPFGATIVSYRYDYTNPSSVGRAMYANISVDISEPSGSYTITKPAELQTDVDLNGHILRVADATLPGQVPAFHQIGDAVAIEVERAEAAEQVLADRVTALEAEVQSLFQYFFKRNRTDSIS